MARHGLLISGVILMKKNSLFFLFLLFLFGCSESSDDEARVANDCGIEKVRSTLKDINLYGPLDINNTKDTYIEAFTEKDRKKAFLRWVEFENKYRSSKGCIYEFSTDEESWSNLSGKKGFILILDGEVKEALITTRS